MRGEGRGGGGSGSGRVSPLDVTYKVAHVYKGSEKLWREEAAEDLSIPFGREDEAQCAQDVGTYLFRRGGLRGLAGGGSGVGQAVTPGDAMRRGTLLRGSIRAICMLGSEFMHEQLAKKEDAIRLANLTYDLQPLEQSPLTPSASGLPQPALPLPLPPRNTIRSPAPQFLPPSLSPLSPSRPPPAGASSS